MPFRLPVDIANRALQHLGKSRIASFTDESDEASEMSNAYDTLRLDEMSYNLWTFATRRVILRPVGIDSVIWTPPTWSATTWAVGAVVAFTPLQGPYRGTAGYWQAKAVKTGSNTILPDNDPDWQHYFGPVALDLHDSTKTYQAGEIVLVPAPWAIGTTYAANAVVESGNVWYVSLAAGNVGNAVSNTTFWVAWQSGGRTDWGLTTSESPVPLTYPGVYTVYLSRYNNNQDVPAAGVTTWTVLVGTIAAVDIVYPAGAGLSVDRNTANLFHLPVGFLKRAPTDPKGGQIPYLGAFSGVMPEDWTLEGDYLVSGDAGPILLRFVADVTNVAAMDTSFCEGLAARMAVELAGALQADDKRQAADRAYRRTMANARLSNAIEVGPIAQVECRYILVRA